ELEADLGRGQRQDLERRLGDEAQRPERARGEAREVVAGDVLHHLAAENQRAAAAVHQLHAENEVAQRPGRRAARPREAGGDAAAKRRLRPEVRRLEWQALMMTCEFVFDILEKRPATRGHDELGGLVVRDSGVGARVEELAARSVAVEVLAAAAAQSQRRLE